MAMEKVLMGVEKRSRYRVFSGKEMGQTRLA